jgi:hypothetical protein
LRNTIVRLLPRVDWRVGERQSGDRAYDRRAPRGASASAKPPRRAQKLSLLPAARAFAVEGREEKSRKHKRSSSGGHGCRRPALAVPTKPLRFATTGFLRGRAGLARRRRKGNPHTMDHAIRQIISRASPMRSWTFSPPPDSKAGHFNLV